MSNKGINIGYGVGKGYLHNIVSADKVSGFPDSAVVSKRPDPYSGLYDVIYPVLADKDAVAARLLGASTKDIHRARAWAGECGITTINREWLKSKFRGNTAHPKDFV